MTDISYSLVRSRRKTIAIQVTPGGEVVVRAPLRMARRDIRAFVESKRGWIQGHLETCRALEGIPALTEEALEALANQAKTALPGKLAFFAPRVGVSFGRVTIRCQKSRWGSCSGAGNLNFNCLLMLCPEPVIDYVVVHELCHRRQMNHSSAFWAEVERVLPEYREAKQWLKEHGREVMAAGRARCQYKPSAGQTTSVS